MIWEPSYNFYRKRYSEQLEYVKSLPRKYNTKESQRGRDVLKSALSVLHRLFMELIEQDANEIFFHRKATKQYVDNLVEASQNKNDKINP